MSDASEKMCLKAVDALRARDFEAEFLRSGADACDWIVNRFSGVKTLGSGGSATLKAIGVIDRLKAAGVRTFPHGDAREQSAELYLLSANALTLDGRIVNVDGTGNRVSDSVYGPGRVIYVIGRNKIVDGGVDAALERVHAKASPPNCVRLGRRTPCAVTGKCADCASPDRICKVTVVFDRRPTRTPVTVLVVDEDLGY